MLTGKVRKVQELELSDGRRPFVEWFTRLKDIQARVKIRRAIDRIEIDGYFSVYFGLDGEKLVLLIAGGDKSTQKRDVLKAKGFWSLYQSEKEKK